MDGWVACLSKEPLKEVQPAGFQWRILVPHDGGNANQRFPFWQGESPGEIQYTG